MGKFRKLPLLVLMMMATSCMMYVPMAFAIHLKDWETARTFFYHATFLLILTTLLAIAMPAAPRRQATRSHLLTLIVGFAVLPVLMALPFNHLVPSVTLFQSYFEMLSCLTTTGATLFDAPDALTDPLHLWRGLVAWMGGFSMLVVALALFFPLNIGGFEVFETQKNDQKASSLIETFDMTARLRRYGGQILPIYASATLILMMSLMVAGDRTLVAAIHAMSILSTSGISPVGGLSNAASGYVGEVLLFVFFIFAISRHLFKLQNFKTAVRLAVLDREVSMALTFVLAISVLLFMRHWTAAYEVDAIENTKAALVAFWGGAFTIASFMTTTGFESTAWQDARTWSGLGTPGILLLGVTLLGGGIATTAGGLKLLRIYALYKHGVREMGRLSFPSSVAGSGDRARHLRRDGAYIAWIVFMLFLISLAVTMLALSLTGLNFQQSLTFGIAALTTTGPVVYVASDFGLSYALISDSAKAILAVAMILGRLEALAVIAVLNPQYWR